MPQANSYLAWELKSVEGDFVPEKRERVKPAPGYMRIRVHAAGLNRRDAWIWKGKYAGLAFPAVLGSDVSGIVEELGETGEGEPVWQIGEEVIVNPSLFWGANENIPGPQWRILGLPDEGAFAECVTVPITQVHAKPSFLSHIEAACLPLAGLTSYRALFKRGCLKAGEKVLLTGIGGGVALSLLQMALAAKAEVFVTTGSRLKGEFALSMGAKAFAIYSEQGYEKELIQAAGGGFDLIVDSAGGPGFNTLLDMLLTGGRLVFFGATQGVVPELILRRLFWKHLDLRGTTMGSPKDFTDMLAFITLHALKPMAMKIIEGRDWNAAIKEQWDPQRLGKVVVTA